MDLTIELLLLPFLCPMFPLHRDLAQRVQTLLAELPDDVGLPHGWNDLVRDGRKESTES